MIELAEVSGAAFIVGPGAAGGAQTGASTGGSAAASARTGAGGRGV
jgi:hypothetical protein